MISKQGKSASARLAVVVAVAALSTLAACGGGSHEAEQTGLVTGHLLSLVSGPINAGPKSLSGTLTATNMSGHVVSVVKVPDLGSYSLRLPVGTYVLSAVLAGSRQGCKANPPWTKVGAGFTTVTNLNCGVVY